MKNNASVNREKTVQYLRDMKVYGDSTPPEGRFIRKGTVGQWKDGMSEKMNQRFDKWIDDNLKNQDALHLLV